MLLHDKNAKNTCFNSMNFRSFAKVTWQAQLTTPRLTVLPQPHQHAVSDEFDQLAVDRGAGHAGGLTGCWKKVAH